MPVNTFEEKRARLPLELNNRNPMKTSTRRYLRLRRKFSIKKKIQAQSGKLRLTVFRSSKHIYAQIVDDEQRKTLVSESTTSKAFQEQMKYGGNVKAAALVVRCWVRRRRSRAFSKWFVTAMVLSIPAG